MVFKNNYLIMKSNNYFDIFYFVLYNYEIFMVFFYCLGYMGIFFGRIEGINLCVWVFINFRLNDRWF